MLLHFSILGLILILSFFYENRIKESKVPVALEGGDYVSAKTYYTPWVILFILITFYTYIRTDVNDTTVYRAIFTELQPSWDNINTIIDDTSKDKGFYILQNLFKMYVSDDYHMWFLFVASIESIILVCMLARYSVSFFDAAFYFFASQLYYNYFSMMRQWLAVCIVFIGFTFIKKKKFIPFLLICLLAAQFHNSAYYMIPVYFLLQGTPWGKKQMSVIVLFVFALFFLQPILSSVNGTTDDSTYNYVFNAMSSNSGSSITRVVFIIFPVVLAFINKDKITDKTMCICVNAAVLTLLLIVVASFSNGLYIHRFKTYIYMYTIPFVPYLLNVVYNDRKNKQELKLVFYLVYFILYCVFMNYEDSFIYHSDMYSWLDYFG